MPVQKQQYMDICKVLGIPSSGSLEDMKKRVSKVICAKTKPVLKLSAATKMELVNELVEEIRTSSGSLKTIVEEYNEIYNTELVLDDITVLKNIFLTAYSEEYGQLAENLRLWGARGHVGIQLGMIFAKGDGRQQLYKTLKNIKTA